MYEYYQNTLCVHSSWLVESLKMPAGTYKSHCKRGYLSLIRRGGNGRTALVEFKTMRKDIKDKVRELAGDPEEAAPRSALEKYIVRNTAPASWFLTYRKPNDVRLSPEKQLEYTTNALILEAIDRVIINQRMNGRKFSGWKARMWSEISDGVNTLPSKKYNHSLPGNMRSLERLYKRFKSEGYAALVHGGIGNDHSVKITGDVADFILAQYCLPNKPLIPMVLRVYDSVREKNGWPTLTERVIAAHLQKPEVSRIWTLARHGKERWINEYGHHLKRDRSEWFPNAYWAIDGTKLDWVHYDEKSGSAAQLKIDVVFDVFSEKIIGWSLTDDHESHVDHFIAFKQALNTAQTRPYLVTYDQQSGHKMKRMQSMYDKLVAQGEGAGGTHYPHKVGRKSNPAEQLFNRFQQEGISTFWFSDKQGVKVRDWDNKPNPDFLHASRHLFHTKDELIKAWELVVKMWNEARHPKLAMSRNEVYLMPMPIQERVELYELIDMFWLVETRGSIYERGGIMLRIKGQEYEYEVYNDDGSVDLEFRKKYVGAKLIVRYDPASLDTYVQLLQKNPQGDLELVAYAQPKREHETIPVLMKEGQKAAWHRDMKVQDAELKEVMREVEALRRRTGITPERMIEEQEWAIKMGEYQTKEERTLTEEQGVYAKL